MPPDSKTDPPLAKAESISNGGSTSAKTYLITEKIGGQQQQEER